MRCFLVFLVLFHHSDAQFGEIASVIGSLVSGPAAGLIGSGALGGLSGLAGSAGSAGSAAAGAAGAASGIGGLYQLAQAALSLTGTGVGILNQASESSWFPAAVDGIAKANKDFQDRLLVGGPGPGAGGTAILPGPIPGTGGTGSSGIGTEYGKNFGGTDGSEETDGGETSFTESPNEIVEWTPETTAEEIETTTFRSWENKETTTESEPDYYETKVSFKVPSPDTGGDLELIKPATSEKVSKKQSPIVSVSSFSIDENPSSTDSEELGGESIIVPKVSAKKNSSTVMTPALHKLIQELKHSRLTKEEFLELAGQLEENKNAGEPRENSTPEPPSTTTPEEEESEEDEDSSHMTDGEKLEAEKRLSESIRNLQESLKPRQFNAPILLVQPQSARAQSAIRNLNTRIPTAKPNVPLVSKPIVNQASLNTLPPPIVITMPNNRPPAPLLATARPIIPVTSTPTKFSPYVPTKFNPYDRPVIPTIGPPPAPIGLNGPRFNPASNIPLSPIMPHRAYAVTPATLNPFDPNRGQTFQARGYNTRPPTISSYSQNNVNNLRVMQNRVNSHFGPPPRVYHTNFMKARAAPTLTRPPVNRPIISHDVPVYGVQSPRPHFNQLSTILTNQIPIRRRIQPSPQGYRIPSNQPVAYNRLPNSTPPPIIYMPYYLQTTRRY